jgi:hypothetical protein
LAAADDDGAPEVYRRGTQLSNDALADAAALLVSQNGTDEELLEAGEVVDDVCSEGGVGVTS